MTDGAPTTVTSSYNNVNTSNMGNGSSSSTTDETVFVTQLTAAYVRDRIGNKYQREPLFYTLGLGVNNTSVINPSISTTEGIDNYWSTFVSLKNKTNKTMTVDSKTVTYTAPLSSSEWSKYYVNEYFPASNAAGLINAFDQIVAQIVIQSLYYPTHIEGSSTIEHSGFLTFDDYIGNNMDVKAVKGIQLGDKLYTGQTLAKMIYEGGMGTEEAPTDAGNNLVCSVMQRLGVKTVAEARVLIEQAYNAKQLYYNAATGEFSNFIGWYADKNEQFVAFWDGKDNTLEAVPAEIRDRVTHAIKSYGYYDAVGEGHRKTDMMYATIQVRYTLKTLRQERPNRVKKARFSL